MADGPEKEIVPMEALECVYRVFEYGSAKNANRWPMNWRDRPDPVSYAMRKRSAHERHLERHDEGEVFDPDSGQYAIAHAIANLLIELDLLLQTE